MQRLSRLAGQFLSTVACEACGSEARNENVSTSSARVLFHLSRCHCDALAQCWSVPYIRRRKPHQYLRASDVW